MIVTATLRIAVLTVLLIVSGAFPESFRPLRELQRKHEAAVEAWSLCANVTDGKGTDLFYALFFLSGKFFLVSGNFAHYSMLALPSNDYTHESSTAVPPFKKVRHSYTSLDEKIGGHGIRGSAGADTITIETGFKKLQSRFTVVPRKPPWTFREIIGANYAKRQFDWYLLPRCSVTVASNRPGAPRFSGHGHFQQFWGEKGEANCDWIVLHTATGYEMIIAHFPDDRKSLPYLPGDYILVSRPDGTSGKITGFSFSMDKWWSGSASGRQYPLDYSVVTPDSTVNVTVAAFTAKQTKKIAGREYWYGFGSVSGTIDGEEQRGWAYMAPLGKVKTDE